VIDPLEGLEDPAERGSSSLVSWVFLSEQEVIGSLMKMRSPHGQMVQL
jgi:hypothetical protein